MSLISLDDFQEDLYKIVIFDLETNGLNIETDAVLQICLQKWKDPKPCLDTLIYTDQYIDLSTSSMHKITNTALVNAPKCNDVLEQIYQDYSDYIFCAHNAFNFDALMLLRENENYKNISFLDTRPMAKKLLPGLKDIGNYSLEGLCHLFGFDYTGAHTASIDVKNLDNIFTKLYNLMEDKSELNQFIKKGKSLLK